MTSDVWNIGYALFEPTASVSDALPLVLPLSA